jgi:hypothetical protein
MIPSTHWYAWTPLPAMRSGLTGGHWGFGAYHLFAATTGRYRGPRRCPLSSFEGRGGGHHQASLHHHHPGQKLMLACSEIILSLVWGSALLQKAFSGARRSKPPVQSIHTHIHCPMHWHVASFNCISPPPSFTVAACRALFLPALNEARMSARLQGHLFGLGSASTRQAMP